MKRPRLASSSAGFARSGSAYVLATVAPILSTFAVTPFVVRTLGVDEYGIVGIGITVYQLALVILALGLPAAITRHAIVAGSGAAGASALVALGAGAAGVLGVTAAATSGWWGGWLLPGDHPGTLMSAPVFSSVGLAALMLSQSFLRGVDRVRSFVVLGMLAAILPPITGLITINVLGPSAGGYLWSLAAVHLSVGVASVVFVVAIERPRVAFGDFLQSLWIGLPTVPHQMSTSLLNAVLVASAGTMVSVAAAGYLQLALLLGTAPMVLIGAFNNAWAPMVYRADAEERARVLRESTALVAVLSLVLVACYGAAAPLLSMLLGGQGAAAIAAPSLVAAIGAPLMVVYLSHIHLVFLRGRTWPLALTTPASAVVAITTAMILGALIGSDDLRVFATAIPVFYLCQSISAGWLSRHSGYTPPDVRPAVPYLLAAGLVAAILAFWPSPTWIAGGALLVLALAVAVGYVRRWRHRI